MMSDTEDNMDVKEEVTVMPIYVDKNLLKKYEGLPHLTQEFNFNNMDCTEIMEYVNFSVYAQRIDNSEKRDLIENIKRVKNGYIINSSIYLKTKNWNTFVNGLTSVKCVVCDVTVTNRHTHMRSDMHTINLNMYKPMEAYKLSIIRKIRNIFHCAICNVIIPSVVEHYKNSDHEIKLSYAKVRAYNYDENNGSFESDDSSQQETECTKQNKNHSDWPKPNRYDGSDDDTDSEYVFDKTFSYATMARKPKTLKTPYVYINKGDRMIKITNDSWNMIVHIKFNMFYCMLCKEENSMNFKSEHCKSDEHLEKLNKCDIIGRYENYCIRMIDHKFVHCGHCNNLQLKTDIENHINLIHEKNEKPKNEKCKKNDKKVNKKPAKIKYGTNNNIVANTDLHMKNDKIAIKNDKNVIVPENNIYELIIVFPFGTKITINTLSMNAIFKFDLRKSIHYCGFCDVNFTEDLIVRHLSEFRHIKLLQCTVFEPQFHNNLIRRLCKGYHCAVCNIGIDFSDINFHLVDRNHQFMLNMALQMAQNGPNANLFNNNNENAQATNVTLPHVNKPEHKINEHKRKLNETEHKVNEPDHEINEPEHEINEFEHEINEFDHEINEDEQSINEDSDASDQEFNTDSYIYMKYKNIYMKISVSSYNTLVCIGDGNRYCFICSSNVEYNFIHKHINSRSHMENLVENKFVDKYENNLLRQIYINYHCGVCNAMVNRRDIKTHLDWSVHNAHLDYSQKTAKKTRKSDIKSGILVKDVTTQKEELYCNESGSESKILLHIIKISNNKMDDLKNKMIITKDSVIKIDWKTWQGLIILDANTYKCVLCNKNVDVNELEVHLDNMWHKKSLASPIEKKYKPALLRKVNEEMLQCLTCNAEVINKYHIIKEHIHSKKHKKMFENIVSISALDDAFNNCDDSPIEI